MQLSPALAGLAVLCLGSVAPAAVVSFPYTNDFSTSASDFAATPSDRWSHSSGFYTNSTSTSDQASSASVQVTGLGGPAATAQDFRVSLDFRWTSVSSTSNTNTVGIGALGADSNFTDGTGGYYLADVQKSGNLRLFRINSNTSLRESVRPAANLVTGQDYTLVLDGDYNATGNLMLTLTLVDQSNAANNYSIALTTPIAAGSVLTGNHFSIRNRSSNGGHTVRIDEFSVVPEPTVLGLVPAAGLLMLRRRAKR